MNTLLYLAASLILLLSVFWKWLFAKKYPAAPEDELVRMNERFTGISAIYQNHFFASRSLLIPLFAIGIVISRNSSVLPASEELLPLWVVLISAYLSMAQGYFAQKWGLYLKSGLLNKNAVFKYDPDNKIMAIGRIQKLTGILIGAAAILSMAYLVITQS
jgi:hypothetical protein